MTAAINAAWFADALCREVGVDLFFPGKGGGALAAKAVCARCPVRRPCLEYALDVESGDLGADNTWSYGVYGGTTPNERRKLLKERAACGRTTSWKDD